jgi:hypothetical protein
MGLHESDSPTACFQVDTYAYTHRRIRWSMLFDYALVCHAGFEEKFRAAGIPRPFTLLHAVNPAFFPDQDLNRVFDVSAVGRSDGPTYKARRRILSRMSAEFRTNEWWRSHSYQELADVYRTSRIVVNVGRDDYPTDVGMRFAEAMAAGALFLTRVPCDLPRLGFEAGTHFVGCRHEREIVDTVRYYLNREAERARIAAAGREKVLGEHTYDCRVNALLHRLEQDNGQLFAPARAWSRQRVSLHYLDYFAAHSQMDCAYSELRRIGLRHLLTSATGTSLIAGALTRRSRYWLVNVGRALMN